MKRKGHLYFNICKLENILESYEEVCKTTKNKRKVEKFNLYKCANMYHLFTMLNQKEYPSPKYQEFTIFEPKERKIVTANMLDKVVNNLVSKYILIPSIYPCLLDCNVASRTRISTKKGLELYYSYRNVCSI